MIDLVSIFNLKFESSLSYILCDSPVDGSKSIISLALRFKIRSGIYFKSSFSFF